MLRGLGWLVLVVGVGSAACGGDDTAASGATGGKGGKGGRGGSAGTTAGDAGQGGEPGVGGQAGEAGEGGEAGQAGAAGAGSFPAGGSAGAAGSAGGDCTTSPPPLPACSAATGCIACLCTTCADAWQACLGNAECAKAAACVTAGCSESECTSLTSGTESLTLLDAVYDCRSSKNQCRSSCSGSAAGAGGTTGGAAGAGGGTAGTGGTGITEPTCCDLSDKPGCSGVAAADQTPDQAAIEACVCVANNDTFCCNDHWDDTCVKEVGLFNCGPACPDPGVGGAGGAGGEAGQGGAAGGQAGAGGSIACDPACGGDQVCDPNTGSCEECLTTADCAGSLYGPNCLGTSGVTSLTCGCSSSFDCKTHPSGPVCDSIGQFCGCVNDNDCVDSPFGKRCVTFNDPKGTIKQCSCNTSADCPNGGTCSAFGCAI